MLKYKFYCKKKINNKHRNIYKLEKSKKEFIKYKGSFIPLKKYLKLNLKLKLKNNKKYGGNPEIINNLSYECKHIFNNPEEFGTSLGKLTDLNTQAELIYLDRLTGGKKKKKKYIKKKGGGINYSQEYLDTVNKK